MHCIQKEETAYALVQELACSSVSRDLVAALIYREATAVARGRWCRSNSGRSDDAASAHFLGSCYGTSCCEGEEGRRRN